ncbi:hypothetical protein [Methylobacterium sp. ID0610]|uniref:hypothetical protein n=1 Tax=Methylobacterium carpenticola TaxID=3344827 RepID=UPI00369C7FBB
MTAQPSRRVSRAAIAQALERHITISAAARAVGVSPFTVKCLGGTSRMPGGTLYPERKIALLHHVGMTLPEIAERYGITQRTAALAIRRAVLGDSPAPAGRRPSCNQDGE